MVFNQAYSELLAKLPASLINEAWIRIISRKHKPLSEKEANNDTQTDNITWPEALKYNHEEENNRWVMNELKVLSQHLLDYNKRTFEKFMRDVNLEYNEWVNANKKMRYEIKDRAGGGKRAGI
ncbi:hypothetical protein GLOIN_2v1788268 [Rhizophagus irregularis DAOM 181602=DAOM 197198]|uniref:Uncharacterized protein n=1 Tax=Rhizophagus irregularis (strain DAOM 181602 / DAOM 197198 / MUCL 43194) TaxID=747089 RepID=A0A2P4P472_RHIID|nr:hypothetical protein GLOIN_2v1788268 [Rhizophagus irregularis DAOM 181602=DAOM 197198]POG60164.1 hypothetical protein GLOIN_2v1788268 [Rhizophagus irregularis DAOM 181602=DAOM 197198]|eukprot:XP_025167030.1 hypothetical protein GLOIN_2v1788268 [Rhizophagus irregularis DAOM 181602=DAOM 197198]